MTCDLLQKIQLLHSAGTQSIPSNGHEMVRSLYEILTVLDGKGLALLAFDGIDVEAPLDGTLVVCRNFDVPGVIGKIGSILGEQGVNIANFALGRDRAGAKPVKALAVVQVDPPVSDKAMEALRAIEALIEARLVTLPT